MTELMSASVRAREGGPAIIYTPKGGADVAIERSQNNWQFENSKAVKFT